MHNDIRRKIAVGNETGGVDPPQPGAGDMRKLVWSEELELGAQMWADQCTIGEDRRRDKLDGTKVGQNYYCGIHPTQETEESIQASVTVAVESWYEEISKFSHWMIEPFM